jgi:hypothetical protein
VELTEEQITVPKAALDCWERAVRDTSSDPQVEEWARAHPSDPERLTAPIRDALTQRSPKG